MAKTRHDRIAERLAKGHGTDYNRQKRADIVTSDLAVEVEVDREKLS